MDLKLFEIRDRGTFIKAFAFRPTPSAFGPTSQLDAERFLIRIAGWSDPEHAATQLIFGAFGGECHDDPYQWGRSARTMPQAHLYLADNFDKLNSGDVIDVEYILGESAAPKVSERNIAPHYPVSSSRV
jgi:hypothetical protein